MSEQKQIIGIDRGGMEEKIKRLQQLSANLANVTVRNPGLKQMPFGTGACTNAFSNSNANVFPNLNANTMFGATNSTPFSSQGAFHDNTQSVGACANAMTSLNTELCEIAYSLSSLVEKTANFLQNTSEKYENVDIDLAEKMNHS